MLPASAQGMSSSSALVGMTDSHLLAVSSGRAVQSTQRDEEESRAGAYSCLRALVALL